MMYLSLLVYDTLIILLSINSNLCVDDCRSCRVWLCWWVMLLNCSLTACEFTRRSLLRFSRISLTSGYKISYYMWVQIHNNIGFLTLGLQHFADQSLRYTLQDPLTCHSGPYTRRLVGVDIPSLFTHPYIHTLIHTVCSPAWSIDTHCSLILRFGEF